MIGLADCNNFFVSCERTINPSLEGKAVVVMSNNDGCVVARSNEAKALGVKMGQPVFEIKDKIRAGELIALSGNHLLYREISLKVHDIFRRYVPDTIDYSVDEAFLKVDGIPIDLLRCIGEEICSTCWNEIHIPVTIGFAKTKTLSKLVTESCKNSLLRVGVLAETDDMHNLLRSVKISDLWGIGRRLSKRMYLSGIFTAADFALRDRQWVRSNFGVNGERSWLELHGVDCIELNHVSRKIQESISETRTFPYDVGDYDFIRARIAIYSADCARRLRAMNAACRIVSVFLRSNRFHPERGKFRPEISLNLPNYSSETTGIVDAAIYGLDKIFRNGNLYKRAGVILSDIAPSKSIVGSLFDMDTSCEEQHCNQFGPRLMKVVDSLNNNIGSPLIKLASQLAKEHPGHNDGYSSSFQAPSVYE